MFAYVEDGQIEVYPLDINTLKRKHPNVSFPKKLTDLSEPEAWNVFPVLAVNPPTYDEATHFLEEGSPALADGQWQQTWSVIAYSDRELAIAADQQTQQVRADRNRLLVESDWTQLADSPVDKTAWATYRQALRDLPQQVGFPSDVTWPVAP